MKRLLYIGIIFFSLFLLSCAPSRDASERRGLMLSPQSQIGANADHYYDSRTQKRMSKLNKASNKRYKSHRKQIKRRDKVHKHWYLLWIG